MKKSTRILLLILLLMVLAFALIAVRTAKATYEKNVAGEKISEPDFYAMQEFCTENSSAVMKALKAGSTDILKKQMIDPEGVEDVVAFANWADADFENAVSLGAGSLSTGLDKKGRIEISESFIVPVGDQKYVLYIETLTSRHGMVNEGVSVIGVTTYEHFDAIDYMWDGDKDDKSAVAGKTFVKN